MANASSKLQKSEKTKSQIIQSYLALIEKKKWDKITVKDICSKTGITRGTFYQYYNSIYDLMENIENGLLDELKRSYKAIHTPSTVVTPNTFMDKFNHHPPQSFENWFLFCEKNKSKVRILLSHNGDSYFLVKLRNILKTQVNILMNNDNMPSDALREPFVKALVELHLLSAKSWIDSNDQVDLSKDEIINILNTMRVGANYLSNLEEQKNIATQE